MSAEQARTLQLDVQLAFDRFELVVRQEIELAGVTGLFGPSGGGKTSLLRIIAGLERTARGTVQFGDIEWQRAGRFVPVHRRTTGIVFQDARLFDHLGVSGNLRYAAQRATGHNSALVPADIEGAFDLQPLLGRRVGSLSGGERQRVAIARTLMAQPELLLLDEPLAALDAGRKAEILPYLENLPKRFGIPVIYVSHSIDEMARLADRVIVLEDGRVSDAGEATDVLNGMLQGPEQQHEAATIIETRVIGHLESLHLTRLEVCGQTIVVPLLRRHTTGDRVRLHIRAGDVALATERPAGLSFRNVLSGTLLSVDEDMHSAFASIGVDIGGTILRSHLTRHAVGELGLAQGMPVYALLKTASFRQRVKTLPLDTAPRR